MAIERKAVRKRIGLPNGGAVFIPVLNQIPFSVAADQYQEHIVYLRNGIDTNRVTHIRDVPNLDNTETIQVERIDKWPVKTMAEQAQERIYYLKNLDPPPILPDGTNDPAHEKVHYVRYFSDNDSNSDVWLDVELIDTLKVTVAAEQYQEWLLYLRHDAPGDQVNDPGVNYGPVTVGFCDPALDRASQDEGLDPPYRLDPFQNIIQFNSGGTAGTEPFDAELIWPSDRTVPATGPNTNSISGAWVLGGSEAATAIANGFAYLVDDITSTSGPSVDIRFVEQFFEPHTYHDTSVGTGDVKGYTWGEWDVGWSNTIFPPGASPTWYQQLQAYITANPTPHRYPNMFDFPDYGASSTLKSFYDDWFVNAQLGLTGTMNPIPVARCRFTVIGPITTDNPLGRY